MTKADGRHREIIPRNCPLWLKSNCQNDTTVDLYVHTKKTAKQITNIEGRQHNRKFTVEPKNVVVSEYLVHQLF